MDAIKLPDNFDAIGPFVPARKTQSASSMRRVLAITELLSVIFLHCTTDDGNRSQSNDVWPWSLRLSEGPSRWYPRLSGKEAPLLLSHVCRSWRRTALDTPQLWACLHLDLSDDIGADSLLPRNQLAALKYWLKQSRDLPISVCFTIGWRNSYGTNDRDDLYSDGTRYESPFILEFVEELLKHTHRWENILIYLPEFCLLPFHRSLERNFPCLKTIELVPTLLSDINSDDSKDLSLRSAYELRALALAGYTMGDYVVVPDGIPPRLQSLELNSVDIRFSPCMDGRQLRELVLKDTTVSTAELSRFPSSFPLLEELTIITSFDRMATRDNGDDPIVLDRLVRLRLSSHSEDSFPLRCIATPVLKYMAVKELFQSWREQNQSSEDDILHFLRRSKAPVESFSYSSITQTGNALGPLLREMPRLATLKVEGAFLPPETIEDLKDPMVCPRLVSIYNEGSYSDDADLRLPSLKDITQLIEGRCRKIGSTSNGDGAEDKGSDRVYVKELSLSVYSDTELELRQSKAFQEADVDWKNTYDYDDQYNVSDYE